jgi:hypothetical protein
MILYSATVGATAPDEGSAVAEVRNLILERVGETGLVSDAQIRSFVRRANRTVWKDAVKRWPAPWAARTATLTYSAAAGKVAMAVVGGEDPEDSGDLALTFGAANVHKILYLEVSYLGGWFPLFSSEADERWQTEPGIPVAAAAPRIPQSFYIEGEYLYFTRPPAGDLDFRAVIVPVIPDPIDSEHMLQGRFPQHHDAVATLAAKLCFMRDERKATPWDEEYARLMQQFMLDLAERQGSKTRRVRAAGPYAP